MLFIYSKMTAWNPWLWAPSEMTTGCYETSLLLFANARGDGTLLTVKCPSPGTHRETNAMFFAILKYLGKISYMTKWRHRIRKVADTKSSLSTLIQKSIVFKLFHSGKRFQKVPFLWIFLCRYKCISVDGRHIRNNKVAFSNLSGIVWTGPKSDQIRF